MIPVRAAALLLVLLLCTLPDRPVRAEATVQFQGLGALVGTTEGSAARDVSADGSIVVGGSPAGASYQEAWRWTSAGGMQGLGFPSGETTSEAVAISADGQFIAGAGASGANAFRWSSGGGFESIPVGLLTQYVGGISADGSTIVGVADQQQLGEWLGFDTLAWRWRSGVGIDLSVPGNVIDGYTGFKDVSADGNTILAVDGLYDDSWPYLRTDSGNTYLSFTTYKFYCQCGDDANRMTPDASVVVGNIQGVEAYRWRAVTGRENLLGFLDTGGTYFKSSALDVSADGKVVVGYSASPPVAPQAAFLWRPDSGMLDLAQFLVDHGIDLTGWQLQTAVAVSADGTVIVGNGINPSGDPEAWRAEIPASVFAVPTLGLPAHLVLVGLILLAAMSMLRVKLERSPGPPQH